MTREWPAGSPSKRSPPAVPILVGAMGFLFILATLGVNAAAPVCLAVLLVLLVIVLLPVRHDPLLEAAKALDEGEDAWVVAHGLQGVDLEGRAGLCLGVAVRCLTEAGRHGRLEARLRKEAAVWLRETIKEMK